MQRLPIIKGRGTAENPANRFVAAWSEPDPEWNDPEDPGPRTQFASEAAGQILSWNKSPDIPFEASLNPYRGCEHGCTYCYARPTHEYLGFSAGLEFETRILVKEEAPRLLRAELLKKRWTPQVIAFSGVTDCYQPIERRLGVTRGCLEVLVEFRNPVTVITKNHGVTRDIDLLGALAQHGAAAVNLSITTLDDGLAGALEPRASRPQRRLDAIRALASAGIPVGVMVAPVIPGLNDHELPAILEAAKEAGAQFAGWVLLKLPHGVKELFGAWLERHRPQRMNKVLARIRATRGGHLSDPRFGSRQRGEGLEAQLLQRLFEVHCERIGLSQGHAALSTAAFRRPGDQLSLF